MNRLNGRIALITGAARGLGARIAERFAEEGADVIINDLSLKAAEATASRLGGRAVAADVSDPDSVAAMFETIAGMTDRIDILVNNAGISGIEGDNDAVVAVPQQGAIMPGTGVFEQSLLIVIVDVEHGDEQFSARQVFEEEVVDLV